MGGVCQAQGGKRMSEAVMQRLSRYPEGMGVEREQWLQAYSSSALSVYSIVEVSGEHAAELDAACQAMHRKQPYASRPEARAVGAVLGMVVGDALGAPVEFSSVRYGSTEVKAMGQPDVWVEKDEYNRFGLKSGQWTDDASMGMCLADSLLVCNGFNPLDLRMRFLNWWQFGYNNAFGRDTARGEGSSVGLGGNISGSLSEFMSNQIPYTKAGDRMTSGNGSIMRLAAVPVFFWRDEEVAMDVSAKQSKTSHQGDEAAECCRLMAFAIVKFIQAPEAASPADTKKQVLESLHEYGPKLYSGACLARGVAEERHEENAELNLEDRQWTWKEDDFRYCASRARQQPGYIGSYSMDGLAMALHCVWSTSSFTEAVLKAVNMRGDADTVGSITGQLAGALYGADAIPSSWLAEVQRWDQGTIALRARWLFQRAPEAGAAAAAAAAASEDAAGVAASVGASSPKH